VAEESEVDAQSTLRGLAPLLAFSRAASARAARGSSSAAAPASAPTAVAAAPGPLPARAESSRIFSTQRRKSLLAAAAELEFPLAE
jgi:hypothetical protein